MLQLVSAWRWCWANLWAHPELFCSHKITFVLEVFSICHRGCSSVWLCDASAHLPFAIGPSADSRRLCYFHSYLRHIQLGHLLSKSLRCRCNKVVLIFFESIEIQMWHSPLTCFQQKSSIHRRLSVDKILQTQDPGHRSTYWPCLIKWMGSS